MGGSVHLVALSHIPIKRRKFINGTKYFLRESQIFQQITASTVYGLLFYQSYTCTYINLAILYTLFCLMSSAKARLITVGFSTDSTWISEKAA